MLDKPLFGNTEQRAFLARSRAFVHFSLSDDVTIGLTFNAWVRVDDVDYLGVMAVMTDGMRRFGLPELRMGPASPDLREELTALLNGAAFRIWSDLLARANDTPEGRRPGAPAAFPERAGRDGHPPPRPGASRIVAAPSPPSACVSIGHKARIRGGWLTVCAPAGWDTTWEDFIADTCHGMFGFEKPPWHYIPEFGALLDAMDRARQTLPEARSRFLRGNLPTGGRLMVRYETADSDEFQWARVESWEDAQHAIIRDVGRELAPGVRPGPAVTVETSQIADWGIWVDGRGITEGAGTEGVGHHLS